MNMAVSFVLLLSHQLIGVLYTIASGNEWIQSAVALLLPILKFTVRSTYAWYFRGKVEGYATVLMAFEVEFFNTLYTSIFMQSSKSPMVLFVLMSVDVFENLSFLYRMNQLGTKLKQISSRGTTKHQFLRQVLFRTELVVLVELIEVLTPLLYGCYLILLRHLPNGSSFESLFNLSNEEFYQSIRNLVVLDGFELLSLIALIATLKYRFNLPLFEQIGFFLSQHASIVIATNCIWFCVAVALPFKHMGSDYTFQFAAKDFTYVV